MNRDTNETAKVVSATPRVKRVRVHTLTQTAIRNLRPGEKATDGYFGAGDGRLVIRARAARGAVVREFGFRWHTDGAEHWLTLGCASSLSLAEARERADALRKVRATGGDPRLYVEQAQLAQEAKDREKQASGSFTELLGAYVSKLKAEGKQSAREVECALNRHVIKPFPKLARRKASDIVADDIVEIIGCMIRRGLTRKSNMVRAYLHAAFAAAARSDHDPRRAAQQRSTFRLASNPVSVVPRQADFDRARDRVLTDDELKAYWLALSEKQDPIAAAMKVSLLLGGQRISQLLRITWTDFDRETRTILLRDPKGRGGTREHVLPVSPRVEAALPLPHPDGGDFIFTTGRRLAIHPSSVAVNIKAIADQICKVAPAGFAAGDVRRSVETRMAMLGVSKEHRAQVLSHGLIRGVQEKHYDRYRYLKEKAAALALWEAHLTALSKPRDVLKRKGRLYSVS